MSHNFENYSTIPEISLKRKLSFSNSDLNDPNQLDYLYRECREQVLTGTHPVSREISIKLAAVQFYIDHGPYRNNIENSIKYYLFMFY